MPHLHIPDSLFLFRMDRLRLDELREYEVVVVQRQVSPGNLKAMHMMKEAGLKLVYDLDDDMWNLPASNPAQRAFKQVEEGFALCAKEADVITVSTKGLRGAVRTSMPNLKQEVLVTPNAMDFCWFSPSALSKDDGEVRVGWAGSNTHAGDLYEAWNVLSGLWEKHKNLRFDFVGMAAPDKLKGRERVQARPWVPVGEFPNRFASWSWDIAMAPLAQNRFNRSKSCIKMLEAAAVGIPCLASDVQPYQEFCALGRLEWLLCKSERDWRVKLDRLIVDGDYRRMLGAQMKETAEKYFDIRVIKANWEYALQKAMGWV